MSTKNLVWKKMMGFQKCTSFQLWLFSVSIRFQIWRQFGYHFVQLRVNPVTRLGTLQQGEGRFGVVPAGLICQTRNGELVSGVCVFHLLPLLVGWKQDRWNMDFGWTKWESKIMQLEVAKESTEAHACWKIIWEVRMVNFGECGLRPPRTKR